jgi:hypothetical protein
MNLYRIGLIVALSLLPALTSAQVPQKETLGSIQGTVINAVTKEPVDGAVVELTWIERGRVLNRYVVTGETGRFHFDSLQPANDYELTATESSSFLPAAFGQKSPADPWIPIALNAGQNLSDLRIRLTPLSEIKGRVLDVSGKPFDRAYVYLLRANFVNGRRMLEPASYPFSTNSKGEYYFGGLGAGQYYIRAIPSNDGERTIFENPSGFDAAGNQRSGEPQGFPSTYYPGTMDITAAEPVNLLNAEKANNINVVVTSSQRAG